MSCDLPGVRLSGVQVFLHLSLLKTRWGKIVRRFLNAREAGVDGGDVYTVEG
jgi:hypothetical protein